MLPQSIRDLTQKDGYKVVLVNSGYPSASNEMKAQLASMNGIIKSTIRKA